MKRFIPYVVLLFGATSFASAFTPQSDGIYAVFNVTYWDGDTKSNTDGEFTIQLMPGEAPVTCANFIGLAEGTLQWYDFETNQVRGGFDNPEPFYNGLTFHRVVANFVIQSGSRNGEGTDGPGWRIPDEAYPGRDHVGGGVVSMANNGPNTGGSQFFITMAQFPESQPQLDALNGKHTVFAVVVDGVLLTQAIDRTPVIGSEPINPAVINSVTILRQGEFANSWDPSQYWIAPEFSEKPFNITNNIEDTDDDGTPDTRILQGKWTRDPNNIYFLGQSNDLDNWTQITYDRQLFVPGEEPREEVRFLPADLLTDRRHFYSLLEAKLPAISDLDGKRLTLDINPVEDVNEDFVTYQPETFVVDFYDELDGGWKLKRSDSDMQPIGNVGLYRQFPIGWRTQVHLQNSGFSEMQVYLNYNDNNRNTGDAHIYYVNGRNEGNLVSGTFTLTDGQPRRELQDKNLTRLTIQVTNDETDPVTTTYTLDLWDNFTEEAFNTLFEGGYKIERTNTEFIQQGRIIYQWVEVDGQTYVNIDLDTGLDFQTVLSDPTQSSGTAKIFYPGLDQFFDGTFTLGEGTPRPDPIDQAGNKLILTLDLSGENTDPVQSKIDIDFYEAAQDEDGNDLAPGGYEATRTDSEVNQFGDVFVYEWYEQGGETRVDLSFDIIQPMQAYLTFTSGDSTSGGSGTAKIHYPQFGTVGEATFEYVVGGGTPRPVSVDKSGTQLEIQLAAEVVDILTIDLYTATTGLYRTTRQDSEAQPTGEVLDYQWYERPNGDQLILIDYDRLPDAQILLTPNSGGNTGQAEVLYLDSGTLFTASYTIGDAAPEPVSLDKTGVKLVLDLETNNNNSTIDRVEVEFTDSETGDWVRYYPPSLGLDPDTGDVPEYQWYDRGDFEQVNIVYDFLRDMQVFLKYDTATSGTAIIYFVTGAALVDATFTIQNP